MKVRVNKKWYDKLNDNGYVHVGLIGTIIEVCDDGTYGVQFDGYINGHSCCGKANDGCGWYFPTDCVDDVTDDDEVTSNTLSNALMELIALYKEEADDYYEEFFHGDSEARQQAYKRVVGDLEKLLKLY